MPRFFITSICNGCGREEGTYHAYLFSGTGQPQTIEDFFPSLPRPYPPDVDAIIACVNCDVPGSGKEQIGRQWLFEEIPE